LSFDLGAERAEALLNPAEATVDLADVADF
jgi:hypothetical protein